MINIRGSHGVVFDINDLFPEVVILLKGDPVNHLHKCGWGPGFLEVPRRLMNDEQLTNHNKALQAGVSLRRWVGSPRHVMKAARSLCAPLPAEVSDARREGEVTWETTLPLPLQWVP